MNGNDDILQYLKKDSPDCITDDGFINLDVFSEVYRESIYKEVSTTNHQLIQHEIQNLGKINIVLHGQASDLYKVLEKKGVVDYLKKLDHLGMISHSHPSNIHKRWDYVCLQLLLLQRLKYSSLKFLGLNSAIIEIEGVKISGEEYIQCLILFSSMGVLPGTVSSEKAILNFLIENPTEKEKFIEPFNAEWKDLTSKVFSDYDYFKIKYLIGLNFIYKENVSPKIKTILLSFFNVEHNNDTSKVSKARQIYYRIRRISFIYLDTLNSHFFSTLAIGKILFHISNYDTLFNPNSTDWNPLFDTWEDTLTKMLYLSPQSIKQDIYNYEEVISILDKNKKVFSKNLLVEVIKKPQKYCPAILHQDNPLIGQFYFTYKDVDLYRTAFNLDLKKAIKAAFKEESNLNKELNKNLKKVKNKCYVAFDNSKQHLYLNYINEKVDIKRTSTLKTVLLNNTNVFIQYLNILDKTLPKDIEIKDFLQKSTYKSLIRKYFLFTIQLITKYTSKEIRFNAYIDHVNLYKIKQPFYETGYFNHLRDLQEYANEILKSKKLFHYQDVRNNIKLLKEVIKLEQYKNDTQILVCFLPIQLDRIETDLKLMKNSDTPTTSKPVTDVDLIFFAINKRKIDLILIEGKDVRKGIESKVKHSFQRIKDVLLFNDLMPEPTIISNRNYSGGYVKIKLQ